MWIKKGYIKLCGWNVLRNKLLTETDEFTKRGWWNALGKKPILNEIEKILNHSKTGRAAESGGLVMELITIHKEEIKDNVKNK